jgi:hypothetical protein
MDVLSNEVFHADTNYEDIKKAPDGASKRILKS